MRRILLRAPKGPFDVVSPVRSLRRDALGGNAGVLLLGAAVAKHLSTEDSAVETGQFRVRADEAERINETYDAFVLPLGNAFRPSSERTLRALTRLVQRLRIPVVVLGVGAQGQPGDGFEALRPIDDTVRRFVRAVLERSCAIGVRGEYTRAYLESLGFDHVEVVGCPSMFLHGPGFRVGSSRTRRAGVATDAADPARTTASSPSAGGLPPDARIVLTTSPSVPAMGPIVTRHHEQYPGLVHVGQSNTDLRLLLWGDLPSDRGKRSLLPRYASHPLCREDRMRLFVDPWPWIAYLSEADFSFGTRLSGAIVSLLAGTPTVLLTHDARTREVAEYLGVPHRPIPGAGSEEGVASPDAVDADAVESMDAAELYAGVDMTAFDEGYEPRLDTLIRFMDKHELDHVFQPGRDTTWFDERVRRTRFPGAVCPRFAAGREPAGGPLRRFVGRLYRRGR